MFYVNGVNNIEGVVYCPDNIKTFCTINVSQFCKNNCTNNGVCISGICQCMKDYYDEECNVEVQKGTPGDNCKETDT